MLSKTIAVFILVSMTSDLLPAQSSDLSLISSAGAVGQSGALLLSYSIGEPCISYTQAGLHWITEGFQQPGKINLTSIDVNSPLAYSYRIFPNPVISELHIESKDVTSFHLVQITNVLGQPMLTKPFLVEETIVVQLNHLRPGLYFLNILDQTSGVITQPFIKI